ncbi:response regulator [Permianibacter sp. IMCC34836]|nr:response regulator [Permianibacter fluminis]
MHPAANTVTVLIVEDEIELAAVLAGYLRREGFAVELMHRGDTVVSAVRQQPPTVLLLDLMLPGQDGLSICREIRQFSSLPILMLTARVEEIDRLLGLELGADDYLCKPYSPREVVARVKALLRRLQPLYGQTAIAAQRLQFDDAALNAKLSGVMLDLTVVEYRLLRQLASHPGRIYSRQQLLDAAHDEHRVVTERTVDSHIKNVRRKLRDAQPHSGELIHSVYGIGYKFDELAGDA